MCIAFPCFIFYCSYFHFNGFNITTRILAGWDLDPTATMNSICKLRAFVVFSTRTAAIWLIMLATVDRWLISSKDFHRRQMSSLKNVQRWIIIICILAILSYVQMLYCYEANITDAPLKCYGKTQTCRLATDLIYVLITIVIPSFLMLIFGLMIMSNIRHIHNRVQAMAVTPIIIPAVTRASRLKKTDHHLVRMLLLQILLLIIFCIPQAIQKFYISIKPFGSISEREDALNNFAYNIEALLAFIASGMPFYLYTLSGGAVSRQASINFLKTVHQKLTC